MTMPDVQLGRLWDHVDSEFDYFKELSSDIISHAPIANTTLYTSKTYPGTRFVLGDGKIELYAPDAPDIVSNSVVNALQPFSLMYLILNYGQTAKRSIGFRVNTNLGSINMPFVVRGMALQNQGDRRMSNGSIVLNDGDYIELVRFDNHLNIYRNGVAAANFNSGSNVVQTISDIFLFGYVTQTINTGLTNQTAVETPKIGVPLTEPGNLTITDMYYYSGTGETITAREQLLLGPLNVHKAPLVVKTPPWDSTPTDRGNEDILDDGKIFPSNEDFSYITNKLGNNQMEVGFELPDSNDELLGANVILKAIPGPGSSGDINLSVASGIPDVESFETPHRFGTTNSYLGSRFYQAPQLNLPQGSTVNDIKDLTVSIEVSQDSGS